MSGEGYYNEDTPGDNAESETANKDDGSGSQLPPVIRSPDSPPPPPSGSAAYQKPYERRDNTKLVLEILGVLILIIYTVFTALQWSQIRWTNRLTHQALSDNGDALAKTLIKMQGQIDTAGRQADRTKDLADRMKDQADQTKVIATQARFSAETAKEVLHVSERAILVVGDGTLKDDSKIFSVPLENVGRLPSGPVEVIVHSGTFNVPNSDGPIKASDLISYHWFTIKVQTIIASEPIYLMVDMPDTSFPDLRSGHQQVMVAGTVSYYDGFPDTSRQSFTFCRRTVYWPKLNFLAVQDCDGTAMLPFLKQAGNYPNHQSHTPSEDQKPN
jgi:hypothetical protein